MRYLTLLLIAFLSIQASTAQIHEFGAFLGGSNFIGDVGSTKYISPSNAAFGAIYKWNRSPRHSFRISLIYTQLEGIDTKSNDPSRQIRGFEFTNDIVEVSAGMEFTFLPFDLHDGNFVSTPYLYTGISVAQHDNFIFDNSGILRSSNTSSYAYGIPMVLGYKATVSTNFILALEVGARYTFTDEIDGSIPDFQGADSPFAFGNKNNNDWYVFTGITLTYTFGRNPCFCPD